MASTGGTASYSPISLLTGTALLPKTTTVAKPVTTVARPASTSAPVSLSNPVLKPVSTMSGSSGSAASSASRPSSTSVKLPAYSGLDQALAQRYVAPAQQAQKIADAWETGTFLPTQTNTITGETRPAVPGMLQTVFDNLMLPVRAAQAVPGALQSAYSAFKLPGDVLAGRNQNFNPGYATQGGIADALNFVGNFAGAASVVPRPANSLGMMSFRTTPGAYTPAFDWAEAEALKNIPYKHLLDPHLARFADKADLDKEMNRIFDISNVIPSVYRDPVTGAPRFNSASPIALQSGLDVDISKLPVSGLKDTYSTVPHVPFGDISQAVFELDKIYPNVSKQSTANFPYSVMIADPLTAGGYSRALKRVFFNPGYKNPVPWFELTPQDVAGHELTHLFQDASGMLGGINFAKAGSWFNYFNHPGERQARLGGIFAKIPAAKMSQIPFSTVNDIAGHLPGLFDPIERVNMGTPNNLTEGVTKAQYLNQLNYLKSLLGP